MESIFVLGCKTVFLLTFTFTVAFLNSRGEKDLKFRSTVELFFSFATLNSYFLVLLFSIPLLYM